MIKPVLLSVIVHMFLVLIFAVQIWHIAAPSTQIILSIAPSPVVLSEPPLVESPAEPEPPQPLSRNVAESVDIPLVESAELETQVVVQEADSATTDSSAVFSPNIFFADSPFMTYKMPLDSMAANPLDSTKVRTLGSAAPLFSFDTTTFKSTPGPYDPVQRRIDNYNRGGGKTQPIGNALFEGAKYLADFFQNKKADKPVRFDFIPSETEIKICAVLWEQPQSKDHEIYAALDTSVRITAVDLNKILVRLTEKGLLKRKIVSPQNEFTFPIGKVEMSAKNRRNRVFEYDTKIQPQELLVYLQATLYENESKVDKGENRERFLAGLREKILLVAAQTAQ